MRGIDCSMASQLLEQAERAILGWKERVKKRISANVPARQGSPDSIT